MLIILIYREILVVKSQTFIVNPQMNMQKSNTLQMFANCATGKGFPRTSTHAAHLSFLFQLHSAFRF